MLFSPKSVVGLAYVAVPKKKTTKIKTPSIWTAVRPILQVVWQRRLQKRSWLSSQLSTTFPRAKYPIRALAGQTTHTTTFLINAIHSMEPCDKRTNNSSLFTTLFHPRISQSLQTDRMVFQVIWNDNPIYHRELSQEESEDVRHMITHHNSPWLIASAKERLRLIVMVFPR